VIDGRAKLFCRFGLLGERWRSTNEYIVDVDWIHLQYRYDFLGDRLVGKVVKGIRSVEMFSQFGGLLPLKKLDVGLSRKRGVSKK